MIWAALQSVFWIALATGSWMLASRLWPDAIAIRLPPAILALVGAFAFFNVLGAGLGARGGGSWLYIMIGTYVAVVVYVFIQTGRLGRPERWYSGVLLLLVWILICVVAAFDAARRMSRHARDLRESKRRLEVDARDGERPLRLIQAMEDARKQWNSARPARPVVRVVHFGEPIFAPRDVVVWALHSDPTNDEWLKDHAGNTLAELFAGTLEMRLREVGYPHAIDVGVAPAADVAAAGGDEAYFGEDGRRLTPQAPPTHEHWF